jgi:hypothetical protein
MDVAKFTPKQLNTLRRIFHAINPFMVFLLRIGLRWMMEIMPCDTMPYNRGDRSEIAHDTRSH